MWQILQAIHSVDSAEFCELARQRMLRRLTTLEEQRGEDLFRKAEFGPAFLAECDYVATTCDAGNFLQEESARPQPSGSG